MKNKADKNKVNKKTNLTLFFISGAATAVIFLALVIVQNKILNPAGKAEVYQAKRDVAQNTIIDSSNVSYFFEKKEVSKDTLINSPAETFTDLTNKYVKEKIIKGEQVSKTVLDDETRRTKSIENPVEITLKGDDISQTVGGTLRDGDIISLIFTQSASQSDNHKTQTEIKLGNILVTQVFTADGKIINRSDGDKYAASILKLKLSAQKAAILDNEINKGKVKVVKLDDNSKTPDIKIEN